MRTASRCIPSLLFLIAASTSALAQATWQLTYPPSTPLQLAQWRMVFDEPRGTALLLFPGSGQPGSSFWRWNGTTWDQPIAATPPHRFDCYVAYDAARQRVVLYGGRSAATSAFLQDFWEWDGAVWQQRALAGFPPARVEGAFAFDRARNVCVLFGGAHPNTGVMQSDTWEWNGTVWTQANPVTHPSARRFPTMAFDPSTQRMLLHGGELYGQQIFLLTDTWTWDGVVWQQHQPATPPFQRHAPAMVSDLARSRVVLYGGNSYDFQTWEWNGAQWHASVPSSPGPREGHSATYDTLRREVLLFGGLGGGGAYPGDLWRYDTSSPATSSAFGVGCAGSEGVPVLANAPYSLPWIGYTTRNRVNVAAGQLGALFVTSFGQLPLPIPLAQIGMPGCSLFVLTDVIEVRAAAAGFAEWTLAIPNSTTYVGVPLRQQAFPLDLGFNPLGLVASNGLVMTPGIR